MAAGKKRPVPLSHLQLVLPRERPMEWAPFDCVIKIDGWLLDAKLNACYASRSKFSRETIR
jgi:hypothetical protein